MDATSEHVWRRGRDSNPRYTLRRTHAFQACSLSHSDTSPELIKMLVEGVKLSENANQVNLNGTVSKI